MLKIRAHLNTHLFNALAEGVTSSHTQQKLYNTFLNTTQPMLLNYYDKSVFLFSDLSILTQVMVLQSAACDIKLIV